MSLGTSLFLIAVGAVLRFAVSVSTKGVDVQTIGLILMIVGGVGLILSLFWMTVWSNRRNGVVVDERPVPPPRY